MENEEKLRLLDKAFEKSKIGDHASALDIFSSLELQSEHPSDLSTLRLFEAGCLLDVGNAQAALMKIGTVDQEQLGFANLIVYKFEYARIQRALGQLEEALKRTQDALKAISTIDEKGSTRVVERNLRTLLAVLLAEQGRCSEAIPLLEKVPLADEGWADAKLHLGDCRYKQQQYREALESYHAVLTCRSGNGPFLAQAACRNIGYVLHDLQEYAESIKYLKQVEGQYDGYPEMQREIFSILSSAYRHLGKNEEAAKYQVAAQGLGRIQ